MLNLQTHERVTLTNVGGSYQGLVREAHDPALRLATYRLTTPIAPGGTADVTFELQVALEGFANHGYLGPLIEDGAVFAHELLPSFGYDRTRELRLRGERRSSGLGPRSRPAPSGSPTAELAEGDDADRIDLDMVVTVPAGFRAVGPGRLVSSTQEADLRRFHYRAERAPWKVDAVAGRFAEVKDRWRGPDGQEVSLELFHLPAHGANVERLLASLKWALTDLTRRFGRFPLDTVRLVETPHGLVPPSNGGGLILVPERSGWTHDYRTEPAFDWLLYLAARELARSHVNASAGVAATAGAVLLSEALPAALALAVVERYRGPAQVDLRLEHVSDQYQRLAAKEDGDEPSTLEGDDEPYLADKGLLALVSARRALGDERVDGVVRALLEGAARRPPPHQVHAVDLVSGVEAEAGPEQVALLSSAFRGTVVHDLKLTGARARKVSSGRYEVTVSLAGKRLVVRAGRGRQAEDLDDDILVALYGDAAESRPRHTSLHRVRGLEARVDMTVDFPPTRVALDPAWWLLDRNRMDNEGPVSMESR